MKKNIAIIMGGYSSEAAISLKSGTVVYTHLDKEKYTAYKIHILKDKWVLVDDNDQEYSINKHDFSADVHGKKITFDVVFNAIHGAPGENGAILAYFDLIGIKHTSAPFYQMALTFNKRDTLSVLKNYGISTAISVYLNQGDLIDVDKIIKKVGLPCFVKPNNAGSSFGISKVHSKEALLPALKVAYKEDTEILIESFLDGTEVSVGVFQYKGATTVLPITEIVSENDFFDYQAKYEGKSTEITPARISKKQENRVSEISKRVYDILKMKGFTRSEYIFINDEPHFLEINTVPGLTQASILPQQANCAGINLTELFGNAIEMALKNDLK
ncbi:D-alanine--D-alanine ligase [Tenacibaculum finnmarkense]|uniref:D-alanine--D-alanine ligase n=1 Tax=Tenacibaculum finnmarkense genomovar finnmarkense TaxID=1458503 RepID=A0AAP1WG20_9FLAO|nr:D-alanine--D-alanine ligase [Tenacibaculum finnmarkense]MBE7652628.1 D-alanine--D-alanine ligase [Tenacibaculum finnmarkense genomovar finnmarkense]MBE7694927.1 D-alanine--D-alanine ligase [Tenacibaculum finnmarkense genomovar finnmarkense]MCD8412223.1 D-alanine--D-alanine ligase [Tenacibaculum finnmarkense genomovar ulcerans]MCD8426886.1 D-alanine--D-alanine ligase [Tenacibaculum finnmarkense genomovar finnmarkense]MCG8730912.1 D-alanine--D-alanine ligase [Tenacibaculum finnmarkense]